MADTIDQSLRDQNPDPDMLDEERDTLRRDMDIGDEDHAAM